MKYTSVMNQAILQELKRRMSQDPVGCIALEEAGFGEKVAEACRMVTEGGKKIILLTGPSASGKTTTAKRIAQELSAQGKKVNRISLDNFYRPNSEYPRWEDGYVNYESIECLDIPFFSQMMTQLLETGEARLPLYDFTTNQRREKTIPLTYDEDTYLILEGIHALNPRLTEVIEGYPVFKIYISVHTDFIERDKTMLAARELRLMRRLVRDHLYRATLPEETLEMWNYVMRGEELYIRPFRMHADLHIDSTHQYEPFVYHDELKQLLDSAKTDSPYRATIDRLLGEEKNFFGVDWRLIPRESLIQEFIRHEG